MTVYTPSFAGNSTSGIPGFTNRTGQMGRVSGNAYPVNSGLDSLATYDTVMGSDDVTVTVTVGALTGSGSDVIDVFLGCSSSGDIVRGRFGLSGSNTYSEIWTGTGWSATSYMDGTSTAPPYTSGTILTFSRAGNVYTTKVATTTALMWTDSSNTVTRDSSHRLVGLGGSNGSGTNYRRISAMTATDVDTTTNTSAFFAMF